MSCARRSRVVEQRGRAQSHDGRRVGVEREDAGCERPVLRDSHGLAENRRVPPVNPVEVADDEHGRRRGLRRGGVLVDEVKSAHAQTGRLARKPRATPAGVVRQQAPFMALRGTLLAYLPEWLGELRRSLGRLSMSLGQPRKPLAGPHGWRNELPMSLAQPHGWLGELHEGLARLRPWLAEVRREHVQPRVPLVQPSMSPGALPGWRGLLLGSQAEECPEMPSMPGELPSMHAELSSEPPRQGNDSGEVALSWRLIATDWGLLASGSPELPHECRQLGDGSTVIGSKCGEMTSQSGEQASFPGEQGQDCARQPHDAWLSARVVTASAGRWAASLAPARRCRSSSSSWAPRSLPPPAAPATERPGAAGCCT